MRPFRSNGFTENTMFGPPTGLSGALHSQCRRANKGPATGSPTAPQSIRVTSATEASAMGSRARAVLHSGWPARWPPGLVGSLVCADAAGKDAEVAGGEVSLLVGVGSGGSIPLSGCGLPTLCRWQQAAGEPDSLWDEWFRRGWPAFPG